MRLAPRLAVATLAAFAGAPSIAQTPYPAEANLRFEVWDGAQWTNTVNAHPGDRIEWRAVISYTGTRTDIQGLAEALYQPVIPNADNEGPVMDQLGPWRSGGVSSNLYLGSMLSQAEGNNGSQLASYGRVGFGLTATTASGSNIMTSFRHSNGSNGAPDGSWLRIAGNYVSQWPIVGSDPGWTASDANRLLRGISACQLPRVSPSGGLNSYWRPGTQNLVLFRQALIVGDASDDRTIEITAQEQLIRRAGMSADDTDNRRYVSWYTQDYQPFPDAYRTSLSITPAIAFVTVPAPGAAVVAGVLTCFLTRRRR